jgi:hypothetical protein
VGYVPEVSPKTVALTVIPIAGVGIGLTFYLWKLRQKIITITFDKPQTNACTPDTQGVTISITDGLGRPLADKEFTLQLYFNGNAGPQYTLRTGADGTWRTTWSEADWYTDKQIHLDQDVLETVTFEVTCDNQVARNSYTALFKACTNFSLCCRDTSTGEIQYHCYITKCPSGTVPC